MRPAVDADWRVRRVRDVLGRLYVEYHETNDRHFAGLLPMIPLYIESAARPGKERTVAFLWADDFTGQPRYIVLDDASVQSESWKAITDTLKHEMIHVWQAVTGRAVNHGPAFKRMAKKLDISQRAVD